MTEGNIIIGSHLSIKNPAIRFRIFGNTYYVHMSSNQRQTSRIFIRTLNSQLLISKQNK